MSIRALTRRVRIFFKSRYRRLLLSSAETDIKRLEHDYETLPGKISAHRGYAAELRVELALLEQKASKS